MAESPPAPRVEDCIEPLGRAECSPVVAPGVDRLLADLAGRQHGVVARRQLLAAGVGRRAIGSRLERGVLHSLHRGVYAVGHPLVSRLGSWMAAVLACGPGTVLSHRSAAAFWQIAPWAGAIEVTRPRTFRGLPGVEAHRGSPAADEVEVVDGIPVTGISRTLLDLAGILDQPRLERAMSQAEVLRLTDRVSLPQLLARYPTRRGVAALKAILADGRASNGVTASKLEDAFQALVAAYDLPPPRLNADLLVGDRHLRPDATWSLSKLIIELDGRAVHGTRRAFERDRERDRLLLAHGWRVVRVTWRQLRDEPTQIAADLRELLRS